MTYAGASGQWGSQQLAGIRHPCHLLPAVIALPLLPGPCRHPAGVAGAHKRGCDSPAAERPRVLWRGTRAGGGAWGRVGRICHDPPPLWLQGTQSLSALLKGALFPWECRKIIAFQLSLPATTPVGAIVAPVLQDSSQPVYTHVGKRPSRLPRHRQVAPACGMQVCRHAAGWAVLRCAARMPCR